MLEQKKCQSCEQNILPLPMVIRGKYDIRFEPIHIFRDILCCPECKSEIFDLTYEISNIEKALEVYRQKKNSPSPEELGLCRRRLNLGLKQMAKKVGATAEDVIGYENGVLATEKQYRIYRQLMAECGLG